MSAYNQEFNKDNTILRYLVVGMLAELSKKVYYYNQVDEDTLKKIEVPFFYSVSGNERFLLDNFMFDAEKAGKAVGDYEVVPRGIIQMNSMSINSDEQTNKFTRAEFVREYQGVLKTFSLMTNFLPITIGFGVTIICSNNLEMLKVTESVMSKLYKGTLFNCDLGMFRVNASMSVPEEFSQERLFEWGLNDKKEFKVTFDMELKSFMPVFESGILLPEIDLITKESIANNPNANGVGQLRSDSNGNLGIQFGGVLQGISQSLTDIRMAPGNTSIWSNGGFNSTTDKEVGGPFGESAISSAPPPEESQDSKNYRNAKKDEE